MAITPTPPDDTTGVFDDPARWRRDIIADFRLRSDERCAAASPSPGFPQLLESVVWALADAPEGTWLDVGGGLGGTASWLERRHGKRVLVADAAFGSVSAAHELFPSLGVVAAEAAALPVRGRSVPVAVASGLVSLLAEVDTLLDELCRILVPGGRVACTDLWSAQPSTLRTGPNTFWSLEEFETVARRHGFATVHVAVSDLTTGWWSSAAEQVADEIGLRHRDDAAYGAWRDDRDHLQATMASGAVVAAGMVLG